MTYRDAVARLYSLEQTGIKLGLDNIRDFCQRLGNPEEKFLSVHIAGTNGKGTVAALMAEMLRRDGWRVGRYTSPHLRNFRERIEIDGRQIPALGVTHFVERHWALIRRKRYSYFEVVTAMAFDAFAQSGVDIGVIEVGLGGRFDATNILDPALCIITQIDFDHERILGRTLGKIAFEKSGIIKAGRPVLIGPVTGDVRSVLERMARVKQAPLFDAGAILSDPGLPDGRRLKSTGWTLPLFGKHQTRNLGIAISGLALLHDSGIAPPARCLRSGARRVHWPGRFQFEESRPLVIYDVAHNPSGAAAFARTWHELYGRKRGAFVFTTKDDKGYDSMWQAMAPLTSAWVGCPLPHTPGIPRIRMERMARSTRTPFEWRDHAHLALNRAKEIAGPGGMVAVVGSHYLVGDLIPTRLLIKDARSRPLSKMMRWAEILTALRATASQ